MEIRKEDKDKKEYNEGTEKLWKQWGGIDEVERPKM